MTRKVQNGEVFVFGFRPDSGAYPGLQVILKIRKIARGPGGDVLAGWEYLSGDGSRNPSPAGFGTREEAILYAESLGIDFEELPSEPDFRELRSGRLRVREDSGNEGGGK